MAMTGANSIAVQLEQVQSEIPVAFEQSNDLDKLIQDNGRAELVSTKSFRIPFETALPASYEYINLDSSTVALPAGGSSEYLQGTTTPLATCVPLEWTKLAQLVDKPPTAVTNIVTKEMGKAMTRLKQARDMDLCSGDGTGKLGTITAINGLVITLDSTTYGARLIVKNQFVQIFNGTALRPSGGATNSVQALSVYTQLGQAQTITLDIAPAGMAVGDFVMANGVANGGPVGHHGILSFLSNSQTGMTLNTNRATNNFLLANGYDATQGQVTLPLLRIMLDQIINALGDDAVMPDGGLVIHTSQGQVAQYEQLGEQFGQIIFEGGKAGDLDPMFRGKKSVDGHPILKNIHAHNSRWDALKIACWGKVKWGNPPFWFNQDGQTVFPIMGANGSPTTGARSFLCDTFDYYVDNFKAQSSLYNTAPATGY